MNGSRRQVQKRGLKPPAHERSPKLDTSIRRFEAAGKTQDTCQILLDLFPIENLRCTGGDKQRCDRWEGFNVRQASIKEGTEMGLGLRTIKERARLLGGSLDLWSQEGKGTRITLSVPIKRGAIRHDQIQKG